MDNAVVAWGRHGMSRFELFGKHAGERELLRVDETPCTCLVMNNLADDLD